MGMNITEFAALAGVSKTAVSRYFNNGYLSAEKRAAIEEAVRRTGYSPSEAARGLRTRRTRQIGVVLPRLSGESTARVVDGISFVLGDKGYRMLLANTANRPEREVEYLDALRQSGVDGVIFLASIFTPEHRAVLKSMHMPVVIVAQQYDGYSCVYHDDLGAARDLTSLLIQRGSHPAYIGVTAQDRAAGLSRRELMDKRISPELEQIMEDRKIYQHAAGERQVFVTDSGEKYTASVAAPIISEGDVLGLVLFVEDGEPLVTGETEYKLAQTIAAFLGKHMES